MSALEPPLLIITDSKSLGPKSERLGQAWQELPVSLLWSPCHLKQNPL